ncbi:hypothetical protein L9F63_011366 [Diploptera punctata]|uniref:G domain-containing protein n=1 Tax=Diploptera punctata TaxID=6984 RepID=A0AAD8AH96_DIPPU|nr:hypothetical protein L9F63_011366 [Diploptera punctata]
MYTEHTRTFGNLGYLRSYQKPNIQELEQKFDVIIDKILFNSVLEDSKLSWRENKILEARNRSKLINKINEKNFISEIPIAIKYLQPPELNTSNIQEEVQTNSENEIIHLPYNIRTGLDVSNEASNQHELISDFHNEKIPEQIIEELTAEDVNEPSMSKWMSDYECYNECEELDLENEKPWELNYGTPSVSTPSSNVPCGGCGALLHCRDTAIPGYLPSEIFKRQSKETLRSIVCQRCHFMRQYNTALNVIVPPDEYPTVMSHVKNQFALIILMVDLLDFPCSIWPGVMDIIGKKQPIIVVGNKVDLLPPDSRGYLNHIKESLTENLDNCGIPPGNIEHISLISAKTGYGVEELITKLHNIWKYKGDVYLIGCTNVGKSTLFNTLLQSDFCKVKAVDLVQRATTSPWPGTTINLIKFPILRPSGWRLYQRTERLKSVRQQIHAERKLRYEQLKEKTSSRIPALIGHIGMTFYEKEPVESTDPFSMGRAPQYVKPLSGLNPSDKDYAMSKWCYDTPGVVHPEQLFLLKPLKELMITLPKRLLFPRTFRLKPGMTIFNGRWIKIDQMNFRIHVRTTVFASELLPITVCNTDDAEELYKVLLGSKLLAVPCGEQARLSQWPALEPHPNTLELEGTNSRKSSGDIILSSAGWIAVTPYRGKKCILRGWTPNGKGVYLRKPAVLPYAVNLCGQKIRYSPAYDKGKQVYQMMT